MPAFSKCPHCNSNFFELRQTQVANANFVMYFVQCTSCGAPFAVQDATNTGAELHRQSEAIKKIAQHLGVHVDL